MGWEKIDKKSRYSAQAGNACPDQEIAVEYIDTVIYPDKVRLNCHYYRNYSFLKDIEMIFATVLGRKVQYAGEEI